MGTQSQFYFTAILMIPPATACINARMSRYFPACTNPSALWPWKQHAGAPVIVPDTGGNLGAY